MSDAYFTNLYPEEYPVSEIMTSFGIFSLKGQPQDLHKTSQMSYGFLLLVNLRTYPTVSVLFSWYISFG